MVTTVRDPNLSEKELRQSQVWDDLMNIFASAAVYSREHASDAEVAAAILWCKPSYEELLKLLGEYANLEMPFSLGLMFAAACFNSRRQVQRGQVQRGKELLARLERSLLECENRFRTDPTVATLRVYVELSVGVAYLYFHLSRLQSRQWSWRTPGKGFEDLDPLARTSMEIAIKRADAACRAFERMDVGQLEAADTLEQDQARLRISQLQTYVQNQRLYYLIELGDPDQRDVIDAAADPLLHGSDSDRWTWTYDDTLARYFHFRAVWSDEETTWHKMLTSAEERAERAVKGEPAYDVHIEFRDTIRLAFANGFPGRLVTRPSSQPPDPVGTPKGGSRTE
jgi:hypothetical protein